ncbi:CRISPR-associated helicase Cas3' [Atopobacter sp. AH10]|uniref:CRISPR-associated helicase Cas3' n=1 Tax=Atopobacter sp. AH10 TaxID=2315861 RepID=UPI000EF17D48|nr:CRISPR-associated helicase Cas3' [Atopobacter sp. AH10]RLK64295.1 CRISPR-associated helicase Cas3' [Atopobacter sp. AH10]
MYTLDKIFWAKKQDDHGKLKWLPLSQHLQDTWMVGNLLWEHWLSEGQKKALSESLGSCEADLAKKVFLFLAAIHDIGKITPAFQLKKGWQQSADLDAQLIDQLEFHGFEGLHQLMLASPEKTPHALAGQYILHALGVKSDIASIIGGHHGKPIDTLKQLTDQPAYLSNYFQNENPNDPIHQKWQIYQNQYLQRALEINGFRQVEDLPSISQAGQVLLSGLVIMADWIASNELYFPLSPLNEVEHFDQKERIERAWATWAGTSALEFNPIYSIKDIYVNRFADDSQEFKPRDFQSKFAQVIGDCEDPGIFILEAPMGLGKTEAALIGAEQLAYKKGKSGLFFALPTQATSNAIFPRIESWLERLSQDYWSSISIQLVHGKAALNDQFTNLAQSTNVGEDPMEGVCVNQWFRGRKTAILDDFVIGTIDQLLMLALKQKHLALRHLGFSKKVVVIDEAHASDAYMNHYLLMALRWLAAYQVPVIILSATLPQKTRHEMIKVYMRGRGLKKKEIEAALNSLTKNDYPLITYSDGDQVDQFSDFSSKNGRSIDIVLLKEEQLDQQVAQWMEGEGVIGIVVNTVRRAQALTRHFTELYGEGNVLLLHSAFLAPDRVHKEKELLQMIGKQAKRPKRKIVIGTQVIEQSLDIDFDVLVTDLAPMDLLIQRMGRLHRHAIDRPSQHYSAKCYILNVNSAYEFEPGAEAIYGKYLLMRSQYYLPERIQIPDDIPNLVQNAYSDSPLELNEELNSVYQAAFQEEEQKRKSKEKRASTYCITYPGCNNSASSQIDLIGWLNNAHPNQTEEYGYAQVRDSDESIEVIAVQKFKGGYALFGKQEDLSLKIDHPNVAKQLAQNTIRLPGILSRHYNIDQVIEGLEDYNQAHLAIWQKQAWLKGQLGIIFDEKGVFEFEGYRLNYSRHEGLSIEKEDEHGEI